MNSKKKILTTVIGFFVGAGGAQGVLAQDGVDEAGRLLESDEGRERGSLEEIIVTAQKIEESIQSVPIAVSAFSGEGLSDFKIERGEELLRAVPNVNFSKSNFSGYNFSIRGIGTKAVSASSDPAVAVSFNNTPLIRNRLFEQEFFDVQRVEVLRGPQGTLYGRNATGGVVNVLPVLPGSEFEAEIEAEVGNFNTRRLNGNLNIPVTDTFSLRFAGALTKRDGFDTNTVTGNDVNDRDLYSTRVIAQWEPSDRFSANLMWQHFKEDDRRSRTGKQLCTRDSGPATVGSETVPEVLRGRLSQGCLPGSLYSDAAFGAPNAAGFAFTWFPAGAVSSLGIGEDGQNVNLFDLGVDPYAGVQQSRDLRKIATSYDPVFRAENDLVQFNLELALGDHLQFFSQSTYASDDYYSSQDYNRFVSDPIFNDTTGVRNFQGEIDPDPVTPGGMYTDPQLGPSAGMLAVDISQSDSEQWSQEFRLQSSFDGSFNFSLGANYLDFESQDNYYVFNNMFTFIGEYFYNRVFGQFAETKNCGVDDDDSRTECIYIDHNPIGQLDDEGHNYFLSRNPVQTKSRAVFGEAYWQVAEDVKITGGLRYTRDEKISTPIPSQVLLGAGVITGGRVNRGYPALPDIEQDWGEFTGRFVLDWQTQTPFTDETLVYLSLAHGYKGGGSNPPRVDLDPAVVQFQPLLPTFKPEFVNAIEIGTKNSLFEGSLILNATAFYYDYRDYQVSQIVDRISLNENFDAESWGLEIESAWQATPNTRIDLNLGYLNTRIGKGEESIDVLNRTQGNEEWMLVRPQIQVPSNCIAPVDVVERILSFNLSTDFAWIPLGALCSGSARWGTFNPDVETSISLFEFHRTLGIIYDPLINAPNGGRGFAADLSGNELPNSPDFTFNLGVQHIFDIRDWELKVRADYYRQSDSYARVYNSTYDKLEGWDNLNAAVTLTHPGSDLQMQLYVKNIFDDAPITDTFTNSDDTGLTANVFTLEPRIFGFSVNKQF